VVDPADEEMHVRADSALATLMLSDWPSIHNDIATTTNTLSWMYAHYWDALVDAGERRGPNAYSGTVRMFYELQDTRGWLNDYYDDENWYTLALLHSYSFTKDPLYLTKAKTIFDDIMLAWDETCCGDHHGGIWWRKERDGKASAINGGAPISAVRLYEATQDTKYLDFAKKAYTYWQTYMVDPATGHVHDSISKAGNINTAWNFTYNEGLMIGAAVALAKATGDQSYLANAHKTAAYLMAKEIETTALGTIMSDGKCSGDGDMFKAPASRYLNELYQADPTHTEYRDFLKRSATAAWTLARDTATGGISCDWQGPFDAGAANAGSLGSAAVGIAAAAKAMGPGKQRPKLAYEAEEGDLHGVGMEATHTGFSGWAYVAGWGNDGTSVDLLVDAPAAGSYVSDVRYATGDAAARAISVNGTVAVSNLALPSTGGYDTYASVTTNLTLTKGKNTVKIAFTKSAGSAGYVNLDRVTFTPQ